MPDYPAQLTPYPFPGLSSLDVGLWAAMEGFMAGFKVTHQHPFQHQIYLSLCKFVLFLKYFTVHGRFSMCSILCLSEASLVLIRVLCITC